MTDLEQSPSLNMELEMAHQSVALIVGVTGMTGLALAEALKQPTALGGPWKVYGSARRAKPSWFPSSITDHYIIFDATSPDDTATKLAPVASEITHLFWIAIQVRESEEANVKINQAMLANVLNVLKSTQTSRLSHITLQTGTQYYMGPVHFAGQIPANPHDPPFREDLPRLPYPNFYYPLEDLVASQAPTLTYSIHRASIIIGASSRSVYNSLLTLAVYAAICRHEGLPFRYPGTRYTWEHFCDMTDVRVLADQHIWAAVTGRAKNQAFNCTNGDFFTWESAWKVVSEIFGVEFVPFDESEEYDVVELMKDKGKVWDDIVEQHGLVKTKLEEITCFGALQNVLKHFKIQHVCSMNKSREFGFFGFADTFNSLGLWAEKLRDMKIIP